MLCIDNNSLLGYVVAGAGVVHVGANLTQYNMQYIPCNSARLAQKTLFLTKKSTFLFKDFQKVRNS